DPLGETRSPFHRSPRRGERIERELAKAVVGARIARDPEDASVAQIAVLSEAAQRRQELPAREIPGRAEDDEHSGMASTAPHRSERGYLSRPPALGCPCAARDAASRGDPAVPGGPRTGESLARSCARSVESARRAGLV